MASTSEAPTITPLFFPATTFSRIEPDLYLQRHLAQGLRPQGSMRGFHEFLPVDTYSPSPGRCTLRAGREGGSGMMISAGTVVSVTRTRGAAGIYPNVEILRGGFGSAPSTEEMVLSQRLRELLAAVFPAHDPVFRVGYVDADGNAATSLLGEDADSAEDEEDKWLVFTVHVQVLSRNGPPFDHVWRAVVTALGSLLPVRFRVYDEEADGDLSPEAIENRFVVAAPASDADRKARHFPAARLKHLHSSTFGVASIAAAASGSDAVATEVRTELLADIEGETEEACLASTVHVVRDETHLYGVSVNVIDAGRDLFVRTTSGGLQINRKQIAEALALARR
jgi:exosome complex component RRP43